MSGTAWYADRDRDATHFEWQPVLIDLSDNHVITSCQTWLQTEAECVAFIRESLVGAVLDPEHEEI